MPCVATWILLMARTVPSSRCIEKRSFGLQALNERSKTVASLAGDSSSIICASLMWANRARSSKRSSSTGPVASLGSKGGCTAPHRVSRCPRRRDGPGVCLEDLRRGEVVRDVCGAQGIDHRGESHRWAVRQGQRHSKNITTIIVGGLATDYCVKYTAIDATEYAFNTTLISDGCRGVNMNPGDSKKALDEMFESGVKLIKSKELL